MARAIDGDKLVENLRLIATCWSVSPFVSKEKHNGAVDMLREIEREIKEAPTLTQPNEWVSVNERLPTDEHPVLVFVGYADTMTGFITTSSYFCFDANPHWQWDGLVRDEQRTLFWMPLPAPPEKEE